MIVHLIDTVKSQFFAGYLLHLGTYARRLESISNRLWERTIKSLLAERSLRGF